MSKDPFEAIGKIEGTRGPGAAGGIQPTSFGASPPSAGGASEAGGAGLSATDEVHFSADVDQAEEAGGSEAVSGLVNAWAPTSNVGGDSQGPQFQVSQGPPEGFSAGGVIGPNGIGGQEPGMQAGGVFSLKAPTG